MEIVLPAGEEVALIVRGDSMMPVYRDGDVLIGTKRATSRAHNLLGSDCIIETKKGDRYVKFLARSHIPGRFNLKSYNPSQPDIEGVHVAWAAPITMIIRAR